MFKSKKSKNKKSSEPAPASFTPAAGASSSSGGGASASAHRSQGSLGSQGSHTPQQPNTSAATPQVVKPAAPLKTPAPGAKPEPLKPAAKGQEVRGGGGEVKASHHKHEASQRALEEQEAAFREGLPPGAKKLERGLSISKSGRYKSKNKMRLSVMTDEIFDTGASEGGAASGCRDGHAQLTIHSSQSIAL